MQNYIPTHDLKLKEKSNKLEQITHILGIKFH